MKKFLSIFCALITAVSLTACTTSTEHKSGSSGDISSSSDTVSGDPDDVIYDENNPLPLMDGSTSAIPLEAGLRSGFLGISYAQAKEMVHHTTTHEAFDRLINGEVDLIFSVPISAEQQKAADDAGVTLFMEPVAREGFVFVVNADNPVDSLTSDQIRKIYSGEITNWSQVGGEDLAILPYQRNTDSGSQNYMTVFMGDTPLIEPDIEFVAGGMAGIMDAVAVYDNSAGAIGYSVYSYAAQMYANTSNVKFIAVDGVAPSKQTMANESYPLLSCTYLIYTDKSPESAKKFVEKVLSDEGQTYVLESGYLPVNGMDIPEKYFPYEAVGTGEKRPAGLPSQKYSDAPLVAGTDENYAILEANGAYTLQALKDKQLQGRINADIAQAVSKFFKPFEDIHIMTNDRNGYLSIILYTLCNNDSYDYVNRYEQIETLNYDLFSGKKIERFSDLFYEGEDFVPLLNKQLAANISAEYYYNPTKLDFYCILGEPKIFTINSVGFEPGNPYFEYADFVPYTSYGEITECEYISVISQYRDVTSLLEDKWAENVHEYPLNNEWKTTYVYEGDDLYLRFTDSDFHTAEEVQTQDKFWYELQRRAWEHIRKTLPDYRSIGAINCGKTAGYYYVRHHSVAADDINSLNFDADTLEILTMDMLADGDWRQYINDERPIFAECSTLYPTTWWSFEEDTVTVYAFADRYIEDTWPGTRLEIPVENINKKYLEINL